MILVVIHGDLWWMLMVYGGLCWCGGDFWLFLIDLSWSMAMNDG